jgi:Asp-tRNA(Asn)/Glu-tRNA(Gln) amidotransferase A subunit family amidase
VFKYTEYFQWRQVIIFVLARIFAHLPLSGLSLSGLLHVQYAGNKDREKGWHMYSTPLSLTTTIEPLRNGQIALDTYINEICDRIESVEPYIEALLPEQNRRNRLLAESRKLQERFPDPATRPALYGALLGVKDLFHIDGFATQAGSRLPTNLFSGPEALCIKKLRAAGVLVLGLTVAAEFAYTEPGRTRNPQNPEHTPGGSSSGSAAAVAAGYCQLALGTQTTGSIIRPAAFCGIFGFKPGYGRIITDGLIFCAQTFDTIGYFTQDLSGLQLIAPLLCEDWQPVTTPARKPVLGIPEGPYLTQASSEALAVFEQQLTLLEQAGYILRRVPAFQDIEAVNHRHLRLVCAEMARCHADWFGQYEILYRPRTAQAIRIGQAISYPEFDLYRSSPRAFRTELTDLMEATGIDLWLSPAAPGAAPRGIDTTGDPSMNLPWTHAGLPVITLPAGRARNGLPLGLQVTGRFARDEYLLASAPEIARAAGIV